MSKIKTLPEKVINQIAAGEVVERPSSVIKELMENALDAKATWIEVEIKEGGLKLLKVTDNGEGMTPEMNHHPFKNTPPVKFSRLMTFRTLIHSAFVGRPWPVSLRYLILSYPPKPKTRFQVFRSRSWVEVLPRASKQAARLGRPSRLPIFSSIHPPG